jgi:hypothetical protein
MKKYRILVLLVVTLSLSYTGCKKKEDPILGCMDANSINYDVNANEDDGTCEYADKYMPMAIGNYWHLSDSISIPFVGGVQVDAEFNMYADTTVNGIKYFLMHEVITGGVLGELSNLTYLYRQTRTGEVYRMERGDSVEGVFLEYPLDLGVSWYDNEAQDSYFFEVFSMSIITVPADQFNNCVGIHATDLAAGTMQDLFFGKDGGLIRVDIEYDLLGTPISAQLELVDYHLN